MLNRKSYHALPCGLIQHQYGRIVYQLEGNGQTFTLSSAQLTRARIAILVHTDGLENTIHTLPLLRGRHVSTNFQIGCKMHCLLDAQERLQRCVLRYVCYIWLERLQVTWFAIYANIARIAIRSTIENRNIY